MSRTRQEKSQLKKFGANVRRERVAMGLTQQRLAEMVELNIRNLQKIEAAETNVLVTTLVRLRRALGCSADKLVPRE
ncbi:MAG TPA: helix-turn-helix transcriptional regulator [Verrucomicrobiae bacterium]